MFLSGSKKIEQNGPGFGERSLILNIVLDNVRILYNIHYTKYRIKDGE
jgi:hypothetical protein